MSQALSDWGVYLTFIYAAFSIVMILWGIAAHGADFSITEEQKIDRELTAYKKDRGLNIYVPEYKPFSMKPLGSAETKGVKESEE